MRTTAGRQTNSPVSARPAILGVPVDPLPLAGVLERLSEWLAQPWGGLRHIVTVNPEYIVAAQRDPAFAAVLRGSALATADGVGVVLAARLLGLPYGPRVTGVDLVEGVAGIADERCRMFLLGAAPGVAELAAERLSARHPRIHLVGCYSGSPDASEFPEIERRIAETQPTVLLVAFGHPRQDLWISEYRETLAAHGILLSAGVGGAFDYLSGRVRRSPRWLRRLGLEWLYRLVFQPWRWRRQLALPVFVWLVLRERLRSRPRRR
jgi:N-acetylglucosaminyldiphosphoundecaprenol N-acetyl-beta-D-mannosaminyltransferase